MFRFFIFLLFVHQVYSNVHLKKYFNFNAINHCNQPNFIDFDKAMRYSFYQKNRLMTYDDSELTERIIFYKNIYNNNLPSSTNFSVKPKLPKIIHQIWLGSKMPRRFAQISAKWIQMHPGWQYILWDDQKIKELFPLYNQIYFDKAKNYAEKSDILRYEILYRFGGIYADTDYECLKPFDFLCQFYNFFVGIAPLDAGTYDIGNSIIASCAGHPILKHIIETIAEDSSRKLIIYRTGPIHFTKSFLFIAPHLKDSFIALPVSYLYPMGYYQSSSDKSELFIDQESFGVHYWAGTWYKK